MSSNNKCELQCPKCCAINIVEFGNSFYDTSATYHCYSCGITTHARIQQMAFFVSSGTESYQIGVKPK